MIGDEYYVPLAALLMNDQTAEQRVMRQCAIGKNLAQVLSYTITAALIEHTGPGPEVLQFERIQRKHIQKYMRLPQDMRLTDAERKMGGKIDRLSLQVCNVIQAWSKLIQIRQARAYRKEAEQEQAARRQYKLLRRRLREVEQQLQTKPRTQRTKTKGEHVEAEKCVKCHKRPAVSNHLCNPCLRWEKAKHG